MAKQRVQLAADTAAARSAICTRLTATETEQLQVKILETNL